LDLPTARLVVGHATAGGDTGDELLVKRAADRRAGIFFDEPRRRVEDATGRAADVLPIDEEARIALDDLDQRVVDRLNHRGFLRRGGCGLRLPGGNLNHALDDAAGGNLWLGEHLLLGGVDARLDLVAHALDFILARQATLEQNLAQALDGV